MRTTTQSKFKLILAASAGIGALCASTAFAQSGGDEIIVTATRRAESIQDVPIAVTAIQPKQLQKQGIVNVTNLGSVAPSFASSNAQTSSGTVVLRIRGVGTTSNNIGFESAVGVFVDGAYQSRPGVALGEFVDVERVEVLRGPQGTLFGRNTSAGALNVINVRPDLDEVGGFINATYGNYNHVNLQAAANIPIVEGKVAARITGAVRSRDGYIDIHDRNDNIIGESNSIEQHMIRAQIGFEGEKLKARVIGDYSKSTAVCCSAIEVLQSPVETFGAFGAVGLGPRGGMVGPIVAVDLTDTASAQGAIDSLIASSSQVPNPSNQQTGVTVELEYPVGDNADLIYIGSYRRYEAAEAYDSTFSGLDAFNVLPGSDTEINTMTHELRMQGDAMDGKLSWLVGGFYSDEEITQTINFGLGEDYGELIGALFFGATGGALGANPLTLFSGVDPSVVRATNNYTQDSTSFSVFTHNTFDVTDALSLTVGLRYSDESKDGSFSQSDVNNPLCTAILGAIGAGAVPGALINNVFGTGCFAFTAPADLPQAAVFPLPRTFESTFEDDELIYTGKLGYKFGFGTSAYASFTHGYKSGGFNLDSTAAIPVAGVSDPRFDSETVDAYEIGFKSKLLDNRVTLNIAAFLEKFDNFQVLEFTGAQFVTFNVPKAQTKGVEIETVARVSDNFTLNGGLTLLKAEYPDDCAGTQTVLNVTSLCGNTLTNAPKTVGIAGATYESDLNDRLKFTLNGQVRYESDRRTSTQAVVLATQALNPFDIQESTFKINLRAGIGGQDDDWALEAWATNITNEITRGVTFNTVLRSGSRSAFIQEPRMYGVTARRQF